jgi:hypothetical protein
MVSKVAVIKYGIIAIVTEILRYIGKETDEKGFYFSLK